jgi:hypothetical protein
MAPKKGKGGGKKSKSARPSWMTEEVSERSASGSILGLQHANKCHLSTQMYALSLNLAKLQEFWCGEVKESKGKGKDGKPLPEYPNISKEQVHGGAAAG